MKEYGMCEVVGLSVGNHEIPVAHIVVEDSCSLSENDLIIDIHEQCINSLSQSCVPCGYKICKAFPVKSSGKRDMELIRQDRVDFLAPTETGVKTISF